jgi:O-antigen/teichoic acid export membrane protein
MKQRSVLLDASVYLLTGYAAQPLMALSAFLVWGYLGPYLAGVVATLTLLTQYSTFSNLGVLSFAERELPYCTGSGDRPRFERIRSNALTFALASSALFGLAVAGWVITQRSSIDESLFWGALTYTVVWIAQQWMSYFTVLLRTAKEFVFLGLATVSYGLLTAVANLAGVILFGFHGLLVAAVLVGVLQAACLAGRSKEPVTMSVDLKALRELLGHGVPLLMLGIAMTGMRTVDNILVLNLLGTEQLGFYVLALTANTVIFTLTNSLSVVLNPRMQELFGYHKSIRQLGSYIIRPSFVMALILPPFYAAIFFIVPLVVYLFFPKFEPGLSAFKIVCLSTYFLAMFPLTASFLIALNKSAQVITILTSGILVSAVAAFSFVFLGFGLEGVAVGTALGYIWCFLGINARASSHWCTPAEIAKFLVGLSIPWTYSTALILALNRFHLVSDEVIWWAAADAALKLGIFWLAYLPVVVFMEKKTGLLTDVIAPMLLRRRGSASV